MSQNSRRGRVVRPSILPGNGFPSSPLEGRPPNISRQTSAAKAYQEIIDLVSEDEEILAPPVRRLAKRSYPGEQDIILLDSPSPSRQATPTRAQIQMDLNTTLRSSIITNREPFHSVRGDVSTRERETAGAIGEPQLKMSPTQITSRRKRSSESVDLPRKKSPQLVEPLVQQTPPVAKVSTKQTPKPSEHPRKNTPRLGEALNEKTPQPSKSLFGLPVTAESSKETAPQLSEHARRKLPQEVDQAAIPEIRLPTPQMELDSETSETHNIAERMSASTSSPSRPSPSRIRIEHTSQSSSVGTDSPLVSHYEVRRHREHLTKGVSAGQKTKTSHQSQHRQTFHHEDLVKVLTNFNEAMEEDHRTVTYWKLHDAKLATEDAPKSKFDESTDPFASMKSVFKAQDEPLLEDYVQERADYWIFNKASKGTKSRIMYLAGTSFNDNIPRVPNYQSHTNVKRNILSADDENLKYIPYLGDTPKDEHHDQLMQELEEQYSKTRAEDIQDFERASKLRVWLTHWLEILNIGLDQQNLKHYILTLPKIEEKLRIKRTEVKLLQTYASISLDIGTAAIAGRFSRAFKQVFDINLEKVVLPKEQLKEMIEAALMVSTRPSPNKVKNDTPHRLGTYLELTCLICGVVDCPTHGEFEDKDGSDQDSDEENSPRFQASRQKVLTKEHEQFNQRQHSDLALPYPDTLARYLSQKRTRPEEVPLKNTGPCSEHCYMSDRYSGRVFELDQLVIETIHDMMIALTDPTYQACHIAFSLSLPCWQVHTEVSNHQGKSYDLRVESPVSIRTKRPDWYDNKKKTLKGDWKDLTTAHLHQMRLNSNSCGHDGPCTNLCPCASRNILCERFCGCGDDCPRKFTGCSCHTNGLNCISEHCICIAMNRECGPECISCGAIDRMNPVNKHQDALFGTGCQNISIQRGLFKKLVMGESQLEGTGFGIYLLEPVRKGEFLGEYTGEVISHAEADRRGIIYDRKRMSFLFDLNASYVIDAAKMGNKTRFINHSSLEKEGLNCEAKIVLVNGEHRIKFIALRDIKPGEELLFNYGRKFAEKHGLTVKLPTAKEGNKGVLVGEEALDALDGVTARTKIARGQVKAVRGRGGGRAGRKAASKSAPKPNIAIKEVREAMVDDDGDVEMEEEIEDAASQDLLSQDMPIPDDDEDDEDFSGSAMEEEDEDESRSDSEEDEEAPKPKRQIRAPTRWGA